MTKSKGSHWQVSIGLSILLLLAPLVEAEEAPKIDLNRATLSQLDSLPGIGPVIAERILELREKSGPFKRIEDLMNIRGIGEKKFLKLKDLITVNSKQQSDAGSHSSETRGKLSVVRGQLFQESSRLSVGRSFFRVGFSSEPPSSVPS